MNEYGEYFNNIYTELRIHLSKYSVRIVNWYRAERYHKKKVPSYIKEHMKLINLFWKASGMWKKGDRQ